MVQVGFFTGFSRRKRTRPGFVLKNEKFELVFKGVEVETSSSEDQRSIKGPFESCYSWEKVMEMILEYLEYYYDDEDFQTDCQTSIKAWLSEFGGWGLLFQFLPTKFQDFLLAIYSYK